MAIINKLSSFYGDFVGGVWATPAAASRDGKQHVIQGAVTNAAGNNSGSTYKLFTLPWTAILLPITAFRTDTWGFAQVQIGTLSTPLGILNAAKGVSTTGQLPITIFGAKWNKPLWEAIGLAAMPTDTGFADIYATTIADATGAGTLSFHVEYVSPLI